MASNPEPRLSTYVIRDLQQVRALADPLRLRLMELLAQKAMTVTQVANLLDEKANRVYYHIKRLEQVGLVQLVETRPYHGILEKYYQAIAEHLVYDKSLLQPQEEKRETLEVLSRAAQTKFEATMAELRDAVIAKFHGTPAASVEPQPYMEKIVVRLPRQKAKEFREKVRTLCHEMMAAQTPDASVEYGLTAVFYPIIRPEQKSPEEGKGE